MMPFDLASAAPMPSPDPVARLTQIARGLGADELAVLLLVAERLRTGRARYGELHVADDPRSFDIETLEEIADALVYSACGLMRGGSEKFKLTKTDLRKLEQRRGRWVVDFRDADGKRRWESYRTREEADDALSKRVQQLTKGTYRAPDQIPTFREVAESWLATKADHRVSSYSQWQVHLEKHLLPAIGDLRLNEIRVKHMEAFRDSRRKASLKPQTVNKILTTAAAVLKYAQKHEIIERNPALVVDRCRVNAAELSINGDGGLEHDQEGDVNPDEVLRSNRQRT